MGITEEIDETGKNFLLALYERTAGDPSVQVSMFDVGEDLGLDRSQASRVGEDLMGLGLVEVRTLAGGIGISEEGVTAARRCGAAGGEEADIVRLGQEPVVDETVCRAVTDISDGLKCTVGKCGFDFEPLSELVADLKTLDAQLMSPRPKTAVVRECLRSIRSVLGDARAADWSARIDLLIGDR